MPRCAACGREGNNADLFAKAQLAKPAGERRCKGCTAAASSEDTLEENELTLEENDDELILEENDDDDDDDEPLVLEENEAESDSSDDLVLEDNAAGRTSDSEGPMLEENEDGGSGGGGAPSAERADALRAEGNGHFKAGRVAEARAAYGAALSSLPLGDNAGRATLLTNRAAAALKATDWTAAINDCTAALTLTAIGSETRRKALFRRATAFVEVGDHSSARRDLGELPLDDSAVARLRRTVEAASGPVRGGGGGAAAATTDASEAAGAASGRAGGRRVISCIAPTTPERHLFHESALYRCFAAQTHPHTELVVVDTGPTPSAFFSSAEFEDRRVKYIHQVGHMTIGEKRNVAIAAASGDFICHFDDDDLYAPSYLATMLAALDDARADFVKLSAWFVHDLQTGATGHFDAEAGMPHPSLAPLTEQFLYTYGFSFLYRRKLFPAFSFAATSWGEDQDILKRVRGGGRRVALHRDRTGICLHNQHGENCSRSFAQTTVTLDTLRASPLGPLLPALPLIGRALAGGRRVEGESGVYGDKEVRSDNAGGLFCWDSQLAARRGDGDGTLTAFTEWLWSGNGFSKARYDKLGLARPAPPQQFLERNGSSAAAAGGGTAAAAEALRAGAGQGLESLRSVEGMREPHAPGAITNPASYRPGGIGNPVAATGGPGLAFGQSSRKFTL